MGMACLPKSTLEGDAQLVLLFLESVLDWDAVGYKLVVGSDARLVLGYFNWTACRELT